MSIVKGQLKDLGEYKGAEKVVGKYKHLIERFPDALRKGLAIDKSPGVVQVFEQIINSGIVDNPSKFEFDPKVADEAARALEILGKLIEEHPSDCVGEAYLRTIEALGYFSLPTTVRKESVISVVDNSIELMEKWELGNMENVLAKLRMLEWSVNCASRFVSNSNGIIDIDGNDVQRLHPTYVETIANYLERGLLALGDEGKVENSKIIREMFDKLDGRVKELIKIRDDVDSSYIRGLNSRVSEFIAEDDSRILEVNVCLIKKEMYELEELMNSVEIEVD